MLDHGLLAHQFPAHYAVHRVFEFDVGAAQRSEFLERQQDQVAVGQGDRFGCITPGMDAIHAKQVAFHREAQYLFVAEFVDQTVFRKPE